MHKELTKAGFDAGPDTIVFHLGRQGMRVPSTSTIRRIITDAEVVSPQPQTKPKSCYIRFEAALLTECGQADITHLLLIDGTHVEVLDLIDDHSRYLLSITARAAFSGPAVAAELQRLIDTFRPPASTPTGNGLVFTARLAGCKGRRNAFEKVLVAHKIQQKTAGRDTCKYKAKLSGSTKHSTAGSKLNHQQKQSVNYSDNSTNSPPTTTLTAPTAP